MIIKHTITATEDKHEIAVKGFTVTSRKELLSVIQQLLTLVTTEYGD